MSSVHVVGMGLAGSLAAWEFIRRGIRVSAWDDTSADTSSLVAAGMITPITGQRLKPTWRGEQLLEQARATYSEIERHFSTQLQHDWTLRRVFRDTSMQEWFHRRIHSGELTPYAVTAISPGQVDGVRYPHGGMQHGNVVTIDIPQLIKLMRSVVDWTAYSDSASAVIDCTGYRAVTDPNWSLLPIEPSKGEILDVCIKGLDIDHILTNGTWILPMGNDRYRIGATHDWDDHDPAPTLEARMQLLGAVRHMIDHEIVVEGHRAAIRPSTQFKRPLVGRHPMLQGRYTLNGLGTKGALQGPFAASQLVACVLDGATPDPEINIVRWFR